MADKQEKCIAAVRKMGNALPFLETESMYRLLASPKYLQEQMDEYRIPIRAGDIIKCKKAGGQIVDLLNRALGEGQWYVTVTPCRWRDNVYSGHVTLVGPNSRKMKDFVTAMSGVLRGCKHELNGVALTAYWEKQ